MRGLQELILPCPRRVDRESRLAVMVTMPLRIFWHAQRHQRRLERLGLSCP